MKILPINLIPLKTSSAEVWAGFYDALKARYGATDARLIWVKAWGYRGGESATGNTTALQQKMEKEGIIIEKGAIATIVKAASDIKGTIGGVFDFVGNTFKIGQVALIGVVAVVVVGAGYVVIQKSKKALNKVA